MPRKESEAVSEGNEPVPQQKKFGSGQPTLADVYRMMDELFDIWDRESEELFDRWDRELEELFDRSDKKLEEMRVMDKRASSLE